jgi:hypothetical protein
MKAINLKSKLNKMNINFSENNSTLLFTINNKKYEAHVSYFDNKIISFNTANFTKFQGRIFDNFKQVINHSNK